LAFPLPFIGAPLDAERFRGLKPTPYAGGFQRRPSWTRFKRHTACIRDRSFKIDIGDARNRSEPQTLVNCLLAPSLRA
jgi:hypothetical protein